MPYPASFAPNGFIPKNLMGGRSYTAAIRHIPIASGYAQNIGYGDLVTYTTDGTVIRVDTSSGAKAAFGTAPVGIFLGCRYTQTTGTKYFLTQQNWPSGTVASDAYALVCDDPDAIFEVTLTDSSGAAITSSGATQAKVGENIGYYQPATLVNTATGNSTVSGNLSSANTNSTLPFRIIDVVRDTALADGSYQQVLVTYNSGLHFYRQASGI